MHCCTKNIKSQVDKRNVNKWFSLDPGVSLMDNILYFMSKKIILFHL